MGQIGFSDKFGYGDTEIKYDIDDNKKLWLYVEDCALALGVSQTKITASGESTTVRWERVYGDLVAIEKIPNSGDFKNLSKEKKKLIRKQMKEMVISESDLYKWSFRVDSEQGKKFRDWLSTTVLPCLREHGLYVTGMESMGAEEIKKITDERLEWYIVRKFGIKIRRELTDTIQKVLKVGIESSTLYREYTNLVYRVVLGMNCGEYKMKHKLGKTDNLRDSLDEEQINIIRKAEDLLCNLLLSGIQDENVLEGLMGNWFKNQNK